MDHQTATAVCDSDDDVEWHGLVQPQRPSRRLESTPSKNKRHHGSSRPCLNTWGARSDRHSVVGAIVVACVLITILFVGYSLHDPRSSSIQTGAALPSVGPPQLPPPPVSSNLESQPFVDASHQHADTSRLNNTDKFVADLMTRLKEAETRLRQLESEARSTHDAASVPATTTLPSTTEKHDAILTTTSNPLTTTEWLGGPWGMPPPLPNESCPRVVWSRGIAERCCDISPKRGDWTMQLRCVAPTPSVDACVSVNVAHNTSPTLKNAANLFLKGSYGRHYRACSSCNVLSSVQFDSRYICMC